VQTAKIGNTNVLDVESLSHPMGQMLRYTEATKLSKLFFSFKRMHFFFMNMEESCVSLYEEI